MSGHEALVIHATTASIVATARNRIARKVAGSAWGNPILAPINPVLQSTTNNAGAPINRRFAGAAEKIFFADKNRVSIKSGSA